MTKNLEKENLEHWIENLEYQISDLQEYENSLHQVPDYAWKKRIQTFLSKSRDEIFEIIFELEGELEELKNS